MAGHGTVVADNDGQGNYKIYINNNGGNQYYQVGSEVWAKDTKGLSPALGNLVIVDWDANSNHLQFSAIGANAVGTVNSGGNKITISEPGDSGLPINQQVNIDNSGNYGSANGNYGGAQGITVARIGTYAAAFLGELNGNG